MGVEFFISWRYLFTRRKEKFIGLISLISIAGVAIGVAALIVVLAVMSGFDRDLRQKIVGNYSHITVSGWQGIDAGGFDNLAGRIKANPHVEAVSPYVQGQVLLKEGEKFFAVGLKGIEPSSEIKVSRIKEYIRSGDIKKLDQDGIVVGTELAAYLDLRLGSELMLYSPLGQKHTLRVCGIFTSGMYDYDLNLVFTHLSSAQKILGLDNRLSAVAVKLDNLYLADKVKSELKQAIGFEYILKTWMEANKSFFAALKLEKLTMFIILTLIILVASFNIISTLIVMVVEKTKDIGILRALGMSSAGIRKVWTYQGLIIGILGIVFGALGGAALCFLLKKYQFIKLPQDIYYIDRLPVSLALWPDIVLIVASAMVIVLVSTVYPAKKAAGLAPVEALRYE